MVVLTAVHLLGVEAVVQAVLEVMLLILVAREQVV